MAQINFKPESGADFFGKIEHLYEECLFRASCYAELRKSGLVEREPPKFWMCATDEAAEKWIEVQAALRGFSKYTVLREHLTAAQAHLIVGEVLDRVTLPRPAKKLSEQP
jgi:hypothetical protein